jgi:hypothetical protein
VGGVSRVGEAESWTSVTVGCARNTRGSCAAAITSAGMMTIPYLIDNLNQGAPILVSTDLHDLLGAAWSALQFQLTRYML